MAYNTPETVADYLARFQMEITHRGKGTFTPDHVKYSLTIASGGKDFLKKSCMEFCGSLPGDEKDEDGYSLSGEAKDATASRNGLSRNQMGIEEKAAECKEAATVLANGNAL